MAGGQSSFRGPVTCTHEWCEANYIHSSYITEFFNTVSNVPCVILALIGLFNALRQRFEKRFSVLHISNMILAIGSMLYHSTLQRLQHLWCERCSSISTLPIGTTEVQCPHSCSSTVQYLQSLIRNFSLILVLRCTTLFSVFFAVPRMYKYYVHTEDKSDKRLAKFYVATLSLGSLCWLVDRLLCEQISTLPFNPQGHALWHALRGFNSYYANTFLMYCPAQQRGWNPKVRHFLGFFPYVQIHKKEQ